VQAKLATPEKEYARYVNQQEGKGNRKSCAHQYNQCAENESEGPPPLQRILPPLPIALFH
jgi:hypothetical protein